MTVSVPTTLALGTIADGSLMIASDERNNFTAVQVGVNGLIAMFTNAPTKGDLIVSAGAGAFDKLGVGSNGQAIVADSTQPLGVKWATVSGTELDYAQITANATISATTEAGSTILISGNSVTYDGTRVFIEGFCPSISAGLASQNIFINIWDGATEIGDVWFMGNGTSGNDPGMYFRVPYTPSAGAHTFKIGGFVSSGTATFSAGLATNGAHFTPAYIRVVKA